MNDYLQKVLGQIADFIRGLPPAKKIAVVLTSVGIVIVMGALFYWTSQKTYRPLMTNLSAEDSTKVIQVLRQKNIPFRVDPTGKNIEIPPEYVYDLRLEIATLGLPQSSVIGYELFDQQQLGTTSFVQAINQRRALEGELMRTISTINGVKRARIHLALPKKSTFVEDQKKSTASVVLDIEPGFQISEKQIFGIGRLVAAAVEGLDESDVVIVDANGKLLSKNARDPLMAMTVDQLDYKRKLEENLEKRVAALLVPVVGEGRVVAQVSSELDFSQVNETQTTFDQDGAAVRSVDKVNESMEGSRPAPGGAAGAASNTPGELQPQNVNQSKNNVAKAKEITNYEVPQTIRQTRRPVGQVTRLSVAVVVDGKRTKEKGEDGQVVSKVQPWPEDKLAEFRKVVATAVGLDAKRGDTIEIKNMEFTETDFSAAEKILEDAERKAYLKNIGVYGMISILILLFFFLVVRPFIKWMTENTIESVDTFLPKTIEEIEKLQRDQNVPAVEDVVPTLPDKIDPEKVEGEMIKEKIVTLIESNPQKAALVLRDWIRGENKPKEAGQTKSA